MSPSPTPQPVSLCLIVKNEPALVASLAPLRPWMKQIVIVDTGSDENHRDGLRNLEKHGLIDTLYVGEPGEFDFYGIPIDFSMARNKSFSLATEPWIMWMDGDDLVEMSDFQKTITELDSYRALNSLPVQGLFPYEYSYEEHWHRDGTMTLGQCQLIVMRERIHENRSQETWRWNDPVHETVTTATGLPIQYHRNDMRWKHGRQRVGKKSDASITRNWAIFKKWWEVDPTPTYRKCLYTGINLTELSGGEADGAKKAEILDEAEAFLQRAVKITTIEEDLVIAATHMAQLLLSRGKYDKAIAYADLVMHAKEGWPDGYCLLAKCYFEKSSSSQFRDKRSLERAIAFGRMGIDRETSNWFTDPSLRLQTMLNLVTAHDQLIRFEGALEIAERAAKEFPDSVHALSNRDLFGTVLNCGKVRGMLGELAGKRDKGVARGSIDALARDLVKLLPPPPEVVSKPALAPLRADGVLRIVVATPPWMQEWSPDLVFSPAWKGGGSEVAAVEISKRLAQRGHEVTVTASCGAGGTWDGVVWRREADAANPCDVFVAWRYADLLESETAKRARVRVLWLHDVMAHAASPERLALVDVAVVLSEYHRQIVETHHPELKGKTVIVRSGADETRFDKPVETVRNRRKVVHTSSPDRGAKHVVAVWLSVKEAVPDAELHLFYGFDMWDAADPGNVEKQKLKYAIRQLEGQGVFLRNRVSADDLATELSTAGVWCYPCDWPEIFCVAAVEAQMAGLRVVTTKAGALPEVTRAGAALKVGFDSEEGHAALAASLIRALTDEEGHAQWPDREALAREARDAFGLAPLGLLWEQTLKQALLDRVQLPKYVSEL